SRGPHAFGERDQGRWWGAEGGQRACARHHARALAPEPAVERVRVVRRPEPGRVGCRRAVGIGAVERARTGDGGAGWGAEPAARRDAGRRIAPDERLEGAPPATRACLAAEEGARGVG